MVTFRAICANRGGIGRAGPSAREFTSPIGTCGRAAQAHGDRMLSFHAHLKVFVATAPSDLRASFNELWNAAQTQLGEDPRSGALFVL